MNELSCPTPKQLLEFVQGTLPEEDAEGVFKHLDVCFACDKAVSQLEQQTDPFLKALRGSPQNQEIYNTPKSIKQWLAADGKTDTTSQPEAERWPGQIGHYTLEGEIARGGMGVVLRGTDSIFQRRLAVKVLSRDFANNANLTQRFLEEAQVMGRLQHPGVPPVYDLGELPDGRPFLAMKLIQGKTLAELLRNRSPLSPDPHLLNIFEQVCQTMSYAHSRGIIHRDLKPGNIMVGAFGEVQVMDWGLAKSISAREQGSGNAETHRLPAGEFPTADPEKTAPFTESSIVDAADHPQFISPELSRVGDVLGTPAYMAPEQARGEIHILDERCDVFGLGAILCVILTDKPPFADAEAAVRLQQAIKGNLDEAYQRLEACPADKELIDLAKHCLAPRQADRPRNAEAVAEAMVRYQDGVQKKLQQAELEKTEARVQAEEERKRVGVERQKRRVVLALAASVMLFTVSTAVAGFFYVQGAYRQAAARVQRERTEDGIENSLKEVRRRRKQLHKELGELGVFDLLNNPAQWKARIDGAWDALASARTLLANLPSEFRAPWSEQIGHLDEKLKKNDEERQLALKLEEIRIDKATIVKGKIDFAAANEAYVKIFANAGFDLKSGDVGMLADSIRGSPIKKQLVAALDDWALVLSEGQPHALQQRVLEVARLADPDPWGDQVRDPKTWNDRMALEELAQTIMNKKNVQPQMAPQLLVLLGALIWMESGDAEEWLRQAQVLHPEEFWINVQLGVVLMEKQPMEALSYFRAAQARRPRNSGVWNNMGLILRDQGDPKGAIRAYQKALEFDREHVSAQINLITVFREQKKFPEALTRCRQAIRSQPQCAEFHNALGMIHKDSHDIDGAIAAFRKAIDVDQKCFNAYNNLGLLLLDREQLEEAHTLLLKGVQLDPRDAKAHFNLGLVLRKRNKLAEAAKAFEKAIQRNPDLPKAWRLLGQTQAQLGKTQKAERVFRKGVQRFPKNAPLHVDLGTFLFLRNDYDGAIKHLRKAIEFDAKNATAFSNLGLALKRIKNTAEALVALKNAVRLDPKISAAHLNLGLVHLDRDELPEAAKAFRKALDLDPQLVAAWFRLGETQQRQGKFTEAIASFRRSLQWIPPTHPSQNVVRQHMLQCQRAFDLVQRLPEILKGGQAEPAEQLRLAELCLFNLQRYQDAVTLYERAFKAQPRLADNLATASRRKAAQAALLAAAETDKHKLSDKERTAMRQRALAWLQEHLAALQKGLKAQPLSAVYLKRELSDWQKRNAFALVRDKPYVTKLPKEEQKSWRNFWDEAEAWRKRARASYTEAKLTGRLTATTLEQPHQVKLTAGEFYVIDMNSNQVDTVLRLENAKGTKLAENDDISPGNLNSRIAFTPKQTAVYRLIATSFQQSGVGAYTIIIRAFPPAKK